MDNTFNRYVHDLGIDLSGVISAKGKWSPAQRRKLLLRLTIIVFFLLGGLAGGFLFLRRHFATFFNPAVLLVIVLFDYFCIRVKQAIRQRRR